MNRVCDRCGLASSPSTFLLRRFSLVYSDGTMVTARFCPDCYEWACTTAREALFEKLNLALGQLSAVKSNGGPKTAVRDR